MTTPSFFEPTLFASDPLNNVTVSFELVETNDQKHVEAFLQKLKERGLEVQVAITDGSPLYAGRPTEKARQQRAHRQEMTKKDPLYPACAEQDKIKKPKNLYIWKCKLFTG